MLDTLVSPFSIWSSARRAFFSLLAATKFNDWLNKRLNLFNGTGIDDLKADIESSLLYDCTPNPASDLVRFSFYLDHSSNVKLSLYNLSGKKIADIINDAGFYGRTEVSFDVSRFPSGVYIYKIETREFKDAKKLIIKKR